MMPYHRWRVVLELIRGRSFIDDLLSSFVVVGMLDPYLFHSGTSYQKQLSPNEFQILDDAFEEMRKNTHDHCNGRFKGTGVFIKGQIKFMMRMGAFTQFETLIRTHNIDSPHHVNDY